MHELTNFFYDHTAPDFYYIKPTDPYLVTGNAAQYQSDLDQIISYATENKNPLNLAVPGHHELTVNITSLPQEYYEWPIPFCFNWDEYKTNAIEGVTLYRIAQTFWDNIASIKQDPAHPEGFKIFMAAIRLIKPGQRTLKVIENPSGAGGYKWFSGGACRQTVFLKTNPSVEVLIGKDVTLVPDENTVYELNTKLATVIKNNGNTDLVYIQYDMVPIEKAVELEQRILDHERLSQMHVKFASGFPSHTTVFL